MSTIRKTLSDNSGQALLIAVAMGIVLLIGVTIIVLVNQTGTFHQTGSRLRTQARSISNEGIAYIAQELSLSSAAWQSALGGNFSGTDCITGNVKTAAGGQYNVSCSIGPAANPKIQPFQVAVTATALAGTTNSPLRAMKAYLAKRTLGVDLATGLHAAAALQLVRRPIVAPTASLSVHWGPIVCLEAEAATPPVPWSLPNGTDSQQSPRKFSAGGIMGNAPNDRVGPSGTGPATDQKEYWAYAAMDVPPMIDESWYIQQAQINTINNAPYSRIAKIAGSIVPIPRICPSGNNCGYFKPDPNDTAVFDAGGGYSVPVGGVVYVDGPAEFGRVAITSASFVINGMLTVTDASGGTPHNLHVPISAPLEYPYAPSAQPCQGQEGDMNAGGVPLYDCAWGGTVQYWGFLYVKRNLFVDVVGWNMAGVLLVGDREAPLGASGQLVIPGPGLGVPNNASLTLAYDDVMNHDIHVSPDFGASIKVVPELLKDVPAL